MRTRFEKEVKGNSEMTYSRSLWFCIPTLSDWLKKTHTQEKKNTVYFFEIFPFIPELFRFSKYANQPGHDVICSTKFLILCSKISLNVLHNTNFFHHGNILGSRPSQAYMASFGIPLSYLQTVPHMHDLASTKKDVTSSCGLIELSSN